MAQSCMTFRISDKEAGKQFEKAGVLLTTQTIQVGNRNMHFAKTGSDSLPTILFVHGSPGSWNAFSRYMQDKDLLQKFRMISVDRPGFGYSDYQKAEPMREQSALISPLLELWQNGKPFYLVGHSLGGPLIIQLYADNPQRVEALVLLAASVDPAEEKKEIWRNMLDGPLLRYLLPGAFRPSNRELVYFKKDVHGLQELFQKVRCRVIIIHGTKDSFVPVGNAAYAEKKLVNAASVKTRLIENVNHFIPWNQYDLIRSELLQLY